MLQAKRSKKIGEIVGSDKQKIKGVQKQVEGTIQKSVGNAKEVIKDAGDNN